jgi:DNA repair/transcription protein MET18/MMS19
VEQELFEVVSVYFPVTFTPKPNDPYGITKEALVQSLR